MLFLFSRLEIDFNLFSTTYLAMKPTIITKLFTAIIIGYLLPYLKMNIYKDLIIRIQDYTNSFNALQLYSHYTLSIPNKFTQQLLISGNYILKILNDDSLPKFILYEDLASVPVQVKRRVLSNIEQKHNLDFSINSSTINFQNPLKNIKCCFSKRKNK
jgi:hypothetical protein